MLAVDGKLTYHIGIRVRLISSSSWLHEYKSSQLCGPATVMASGVIDEWVSWNLTESEMNCSDAQQEDSGERCYCYDRMFVHRGTVIQLKQEVSEIYRFRHGSNLK